MQPINIAQKKSPERFVISPDAKLLVSREEAAASFHQPARFGLPDSEQTTAY